MSEKFIPEHVDPFRYAEQSLSVAGIVNIKDMQRVSLNVVPVDGATVAVSLQFGKDEQKMAYIKGHLETTVLLQCQRCMEPYSYEIMSDFVLGIVSSMVEANALPAQYEPALSNEGSLALRELIEDEIILNLPIIPRHGADDCKVMLPYSDVDEVLDVRRGESPFHVLESLKQKRQ